MRKISIKGLIILVFLLQAISPVPAQVSGRTDSLKIVITSSTDNKEIIKSLLLLMDELNKKQLFDSLPAYNQKARSLAININDVSSLAETYYYDFKFHNGKQEVEQALDALRKYLGFENSITNKRRLAQANLNYAQLIFNRGEADSALQYLRKASLVNQHVQDDILWISINNTKGNIYQESFAVFDSAIYYYLEAARICIASGNEVHLRKIYNNIGKTFLRTGELDKSRQYLEQAYAANLKLGDTSEMITNLMNIAFISMKEKEYDSALMIYNQANELAVFMNDQENLNALYNNMANLYKETGKYEDALRYYKKALAFYKEQQLPEKLLISMRSIGDTYKRLKNYSMSEKYLDSSLVIASEKDYKQYKLETLKSLFLLYYEAGDYKKAYEYQAEYRFLQDTLFNLSKSKLTEELTLKYEKELDQLRISQLEKENLAKDLVLKRKTIQRNALVFIALFIITITIFIYLILNQRRRKDHIIAEQQIRQLEEEKKLLAAKSVLEGQEEERKRVAHELHDGLGVLLSATKMQFTSIRESDPLNRSIIDKAVQLLEQASGDVRRISHNMMPGLLTKLGLYEATEELIENVRDLNQLKAECRIAPNVERMDENREIMLYRIFQEMVNNTLKHAHARSLVLAIAQVEESLLIEYSDDGTGFNPAAASLNTSIGLKSIRSRVSFLGGTLHIDSSPGNGTRYEIRVPLVSP